MCTVHGRTTLFSGVVILLFLKTNDTQYIEYYKIIIIEPRVQMNTYNSTTKVCNIIISATIFWLVVQLLQE